MLLCGGWEPNLGPLQVLFSAEPSFQTSHLLKPSSSPHGVKQETKPLIWAWSGRGGLEPNYSPQCMSQLDSAPLSVHVYLALSYHIIHSFSTDQVLGDQTVFQALKTSCLLFSTSYLSSLQRFHHTFTYPFPAPDVPSLYLWYIQISYKNVHLIYPITFAFPCANPSFPKTGSSENLPFLSAWSRLVLMAEPLTSATLLELPFLKSHP